MPCMWGKISKRVRVWYMYYLRVDRMFLKKCPITGDLMTIWDSTDAGKKKQRISRSYC